MSSTHLVRKYLAIHQIVQHLEEVLEFAKEKCYMRYQKGNKLLFEAFCGMEIMIPKKIMKIVEELRGEVNGGCAACCGFFEVGKYDQGDSILYVFYPCSCHPWGDITIMIPLPNENEIEELLKSYNVVLF
jgi:hypothetical protein